MQNRQMLSYKAGGAIAAALIVKFDSVDNQVVVAAAATDLLIGVAANENFDVASGETIDVVTSGVCRVKAGGSITRGGLVTADAAGKAVAAAPAAGVNNRAIGIALASAASGDLVDVLIVPHQIQGA